MQVLYPNWQEYELLDSGNGRRLEKFGKYILSRPDPQAIWKPHLNIEWGNAHGVFETSNLKLEKGRWVNNVTIPEKWQINYNDLRLWLKLTPFKHTGIFPEQAEQWKWLEERIKSEEVRFRNINKQIKVLNLFGYTGVASLVCTKAGARVTHVDASRPAIGWARENQMASGIDEKAIRWIIDDVMKFVNREVRRGVHYDGIIMDPPIYGHGPNGEVWDIYDNLPKLLNLCMKLLSSTPIFILVNAYAISASALMLKNLLSDYNLSGNIDYGELALKEKNSERMLSTGIFARWSNI